MAKKKRKATPGAGRKWFNGKDEKIVLAQLCEVWALDGSDAEAAAYADILPCTLSRYLKEFPAIEQRKAALKERPILLARRAIIGDFDGHPVKVTQGTGKRKRTITVPAPINADLALRYAERKRKAEFALRQEITGAEGGPLGAEALGKKVAMSEEASALAAALVAKLSEPPNGKSK